MLPNDRNGFVCLLLSIITGGIYAYYLIYCFAKETNQACAADGKTTSGLLKFILLGIITLGIYPLVWYYTWLERCNAYLTANGAQPKVSGMMFLLSLIFGAFTLGIWPLINYFKVIATMNAVNSVYNSVAQQGAYA